MTRGRQTRPLLPIDRLVCLLHDAPLLSFSRNLNRPEVELLVAPLRFGSDRKAVHDSRVQIRLEGVKGIAACYRPNDAMARLSRFKVVDPIRVLPDGTLPVGRCDLYAAYHTEDVRLVLNESRVQWLVAKSRPSGRPLAMFPDRQHDQLTLLVWFKSFTLSQSSPLSLDAFERQHRAWWKECDRCQQEAQTPSDERMDFVIPAGSGEAERAFWTPGPDAPIELPPAKGRLGALVAAVNAWALSEHRRDRTTKGNDGSRPYLRQILDWWIEGNEAAIKIRGLEHYPSFGADMPAEATDVIYVLRFRRSGKTWQVGARHSGRSEIWKGPKGPKRPAWLRAWTACPVT